MKDGGRCVSTCTNKSRGRAEARQPKTIESPLSHTHIHLWGEKMRGSPPYDHVVIETTGIAEPKAIRANFQEAEDYGK